MDRRLDKSLSHDTFCDSCTPSFCSRFVCEIFAIIVYLLFFFKSNVEPNVPGYGEKRGPSYYFGHDMHNDMMFDFHHT